MATKAIPYTEEELEKKIKSQKTVFIVQLLVVFFMVLLAVLSTINKGVSFLTFLPLFFAPMVVVFWFEIKKLKKTTC
jgi:hypothetical protein